MMFGKQYMFVNKYIYIFLLITIFRTINSIIIFMQDIKSIQGTDIDLKPVIMHNHELNLFLHKCISYGKRILILRTENHIFNTISSSAIKLYMLPPE